MNCDVIDKSDLLGLVLSMDQPSRALDEVIHLMIGGETIQERVSVSDVLSSKWLSCSVPAYTQNSEEVVRIGKLHGVRFFVEEDHKGFQVQARAAEKTATAHSPRIENASLASLLCILTA